MNFLNDTQIKKMFEKDTNIKAEVFNNSLFNIYKKAVDSVSLIFNLALFDVEDRIKIKKVQISNLQDRVMLIELDIQEAKRIIYYDIQHGQCENEVSWNYDDDLNCNCHYCKKVKFIEGKKNILS